MGELQPSGLSATGHCFCACKLWVLDEPLSARIEGVAGVPLVCQLLITVCMLVQYGCLMNPSLMGYRG